MTTILELLEETGTTHRPEYDSLRAELEAHDVDPDFVLPETQSRKTYIAYIDPTIPAVNGHEFVFTDGSGILDDVLASNHYVKVVEVIAEKVLKPTAAPEHAFWCMLNRPDKPDICNCHWEGT